MSLFQLLHKYEFFLIQFLTNFMNKNEQNCYLGGNQV